MSHELVINVRAAGDADVTLILQLIRELAEYEKLGDQVTADESLIRDALFGEESSAEALIGEIDSEAAGFALFFHNFSTFLGKRGLYIEDIFVRPEFRGRGLGKAFLRELAQIALSRNCGRMEWAVLDWNEDAIRFYRSLGAEAMHEWVLYRLTEENIRVLARTS